MKRTLAAFFLAAGLLVGGGDADASSYIQGYAGGAFPHDSDARGGGASGEVEFDQGFAAGAKLGGWFDTLPFLGLQLDLNGNFNSLDALTSGGARANLDSDMNVYSASINALVRLPGSFIRPYAGIGAGYYFADVDAGTISSPLLGVSASFPEDDDQAFGWSALAGVDFEILPKLSVFAEYKYSQADFEFKDIGVEVDYSASQAYGGLSFNF